MEKQIIAIIGGGMAGLTAAAYLAQAGFHVTVYEQHSQPGGYVSSFSRDGFQFPTGPTSFGSNEIVFPIFKELGLADRLRFIWTRHQISWHSQDVPLITPSQTRHRLESCFPDEKNALRKYFRWVEISWRAFHDSLTSGILFGRDTSKTILKLVLKHPGSL